MSDAPLASVTALAVPGVRRQMRELVDGTLEVKIHIDPRYRADFNALFGEIDMPVALAPLKPEHAVQQADEPATSVAVVPAEPSFANELHRRRYWHNPKLWAAMEAAKIYTQVEHKQWIEHVRCWCLYDEPRAAHIRCQGDICLHHVNSAAIPAAGRDSKNPRKPPHFYGIPLCHAHHSLWAHASTGALREDKERMLVAAVQFTADQMKVHMKTHLGIESMSEITPAMLLVFEVEIGLQ